MPTAGKNKTKQKNKPLASHPRYTPITQKTRHRFCKSCYRFIMKYLAHDYDNTSKAPLHKARPPAGPPRSAPAATRPAPQTPPFREPPPRCHRRCFPRPPRPSLHRLPSSVEDDRYWCRCWCLGMRTDRIVVAGT